MQRLTPGTGGSYLGDILLGMLVFGPGLGAYVPGSIASLAGVTEADRLWRRGSTTPRSRSTAWWVLRSSDGGCPQADGAERLAALTNGFPSAFATAVAPAD